MTLSTDIYYQLVYDDGTTETNKLRPIHLALAEEHFGGLTEKVAFRASLYANYRARPARGIPFDPWLATVADMHVFTYDPDNPPPTSDDDDDESAGAVPLSEGQ